MADDGSDAEELVGQSDSWPAIVGKSKLGPDAAHTFPVGGGGPVSHLLLSIHPDGGVSRLRVKGEARR